MREKVNNKNSNKLLYMFINEFLIDLCVQKRRLNLYNSLFQYTFYY